MTTFRQGFMDDVNRIRADLGVAENELDNEVKVDIWEVLNKLRHAHRSLGQLIAEIEELSNDALKAALEKDGIL